MNGAEGIQKTQTGSGSAELLVSSILCAVVIWSCLVLLTMLQFTHEVNLKVGIYRHDQAEEAIAKSESLARAGNDEEARLYADYAHRLYREMYKRFDRSLELYPLEMETLYILGRYCIDNDNPQKGIEALWKDLYLNPNYKWGHNNLGVCYDRIGNVEMARESYRRALMVDRFQVYAHFNLGIGYLKEGSVKTAIPEFLATIESDPQKEQAYKYLGSSYMELGEYEHALEAFDKFTKLILKNPAYGKNGQIADPNARDELKRVLPQQLQLAMKVGDVTAEADCLEALLELDPSSIKNRKALITILQQAGDVKNLMHHIRELTKYAPTDPYSWFNLALLQASLGEDAAEVLKSARKSLELGKKQDILQRLQEHPTFEQYRQTPEFRDLIGKA